MAIQLEGAQERLDAYVEKLFGPDKQDEAKKADPIAMCGKRFVDYLNVHTGKMQKNPIMCGQWRNLACRTCFGIRVEKWRGQLEAAVKNNNVHVMSLSAAERCGIIKRLGKEDYLRFPTKPGSPYGKGVFFFDLAGVDECVGAHVDAEVLKGLDWTVLADTPVGKRISGTLGAVEEIDRATKDTVQVETIVLIIEGLKDKEIDQANNDGRRATPFLHPRTEEELKAAVTTRATATAEAVVRLGGKVVGRLYVPANANLKQLNWEYRDLFWRPLSQEEENKSRSNWYYNHK